MLFEEGKVKIIEYYNSRCDFNHCQGKKHRHLWGSMQTPWLPWPVYRSFKGLLYESNGWNGTHLQGICWLQLSDPHQCGFLPLGCPSQYRRSTVGRGPAHTKLILVLFVMVMHSKLISLHGRENWKMRTGLEVYWKSVWKKNQVMLESLRIRAWRDVGVAWGKNQQPTYNDIIWIFR